MGWEGIHLFAFDIYAVQYGSFKLAMTDFRIALSSLDFRANDKFSYVYDMGAHWAHEVRVEKIHSGDAQEGLPYLHWRFWCLPTRAISPDEKIIVGSNTNNTYFFDLENRRLLQAYDADNATFLRPNGAADISPDGRYALTSSEYDLILCSLPDRKPLQRLKGHTNRIEAVKFSKDSSFALSTGQDCTVKLWRF